MSCIILCFLWEIYFASQGGQKHPTQDQGYHCSQSRCYPCTWRHCPGSWSAGRSRRSDCWSPSHWRRTCCPPCGPQAPSSWVELLSLWTAPPLSFSVQTLLEKGEELGATPGCGQFHSRWDIFPLFQQFTIKYAGSSQLDSLPMLFLKSCLVVWCSWLFWRCTPWQISWNVRCEMDTRFRFQLCVHDMCVASVCTDTLALLTGLALPLASSSSGRTLLAPPLLRLSPEELMLTRSFLFRLP